MAKINTAPLSGMRDFLPQDVLRRNYVVDVVERVYQTYGFEPLETPAMERLSTLLGKYGEEGDQLIFRIMKRGAKLEQALQENPAEDTVADAGLRYDLTVPLARVVAEYRHQLPRIFKRYQIQPVYRADRPAKGRLREFFQCDVDVVGSNSLTVEAEVIAAAAQILEELGFQADDDFGIRLNDRRILHALMATVGVPDHLEDSAVVAVDKLDRIGGEGVRQELAARGISSQAAAALLQTMAEVPQENVAILGWLGDLLEDSEQGIRAVADLKQVLAYSAEGPANGRLRVDPYLARGLSYYTGPIFEIEFPGVSGSGGGGGRYDELIGMFGNQPVPACGFALGLDRIILLMEERGLFPEQVLGRPSALVTLFDDASVAHSLRLAQILRGAGLRIDVFPDPSRYGRQFKYAEERGIRYALLLGPRELSEGVVAVKDLVSGEQVDVAEADLANWLSAEM